MPFSLARPAAAPGANAIVPGTIQRRGAGYVAQTMRGGLAELTLDARLQESTEELLRSFAIPYAGAVVLSVADGGVLALVGRSEAQPELGAAELALAPWAPAASVFKLVSASALVATGRVSSASRVCYHGGVSSVLPDNLIEVPRQDTLCASLAYGIGKSQNAILAKMATQHLTPELLTTAGHALGFGEMIPFDLPVTPSTLDVPPNDQLEFARTAAGFWHSTLSPFHGAVLAATLANGGEMPTAHLIAREVGSEGQMLATMAHPKRRVMASEVARQVATMMAMTTRMGTARHTFMDRRDRPLLPIAVAGKTGTLSAETDRGFVGYSWFVGFAPADKPTIAFAIALGNGAHWRIKAAYVARQIVASHLVERRHKTESILASR